MSPLWSLNPKRYKKLVYISGPRLPSGGGDPENIYYQQAREIALQLWEEQMVAVCPHLNSAGFETCSSVIPENFLRGDLEILMRCDAVVMMPDWKSSPRARHEHAVASHNGIPIFEYPDRPKVDRM